MKKQIPLPFRVICNLLILNFQSYQHFELRQDIEFYFLGAIPAIRFNLLSRSKKRDKRIFTTIGAKLVFRFGGFTENFDFLFGGIYVLFKNQHRN